MRIHLMSQPRHRRVLIIQHVIPKFESNGTGEPNFDTAEYFEALTNWIDRNGPDEVISTIHEEGDEKYERIECCSNRVEQWSWIVDDDATEDEVAERFGVVVGDVHRCFALGSEHFSVIRPWMRELKGARAFIVGGYRDQCVAGLEAALESLDVWTEVLDFLTYPRALPGASQP